MAAISGPAARMDGRAKASVENTRRSSSAGKPAARSELASGMAEGRRA